MNCNAMQSNSTSAMTCNAMAAAAKIAIQRLMQTCLGSTRRSYICVWNFFFFAFALFSNLWKCDFGCKSGRVGAGGAMI